MAYGQRMVYGQDGLWSSGDGLWSGWSMVRMVYGRQGMVYGQDSPDVILCGWLGLKHQLTN